MQEKYNYYFLHFFDKKSLKTVENVDGPRKTYCFILNKN